MCVHEIGKERKPSIRDSFVGSRRMALEAALQRYRRVGSGLVKDDKGDIVLWKDVLKELHGI